MAVLRVALPKIESEHGARVATEVLRRVRFEASEADAMRESGVKPSPLAGKLRRWLRGRYGAETADSIAAILVSAESGGASGAADPGDGGVPLSRVPRSGAVTPLPLPHATEGSGGGAGAGDPVRAMLEREGAWLSERSQEIEAGAMSEDAKCEALAIVWNQSLDRMNAAGWTPAR